MNSREFEIKNILKHFTVWEVKLKNLSTLNLYDAHLFSEYSICNILNAIFNYDLKNLNELEVNFPAIDLGDINNSVCFQVTTTGTSRKIQTTIDKYISNNLFKKYDELFVIILGRKQKKYTNLKTQSKFTFSPELHILDFGDLIKKLNHLPIRQLKKISAILIQENSEAVTKRNLSSPSNRIKRNLSLRNKMTKDFLCKLDINDLRLSWYEPRIQFKYWQVILRSVDESQEYDPISGMSTWFKIDFWNFYENGIEFLVAGYDQKIIWEQETGNWDLIDRNNHKIKKNKDFCVLNDWQILRLPYDNIVTHDMALDPSYGLPSIYVEYNNNGAPFEDPIHCIPGNIESKTITFIFEKDKRKNFSNWAFYDY